MRLHPFAKLLIAILISESAGIIGSIFTASSLSTWYGTLTRPSFNPPAWVFGPVWTVLYALMGIAAFLVWQKGFQREDVTTALKLFLGQLILNVFWSILFFGFRNPGAAFIDILVLWFAILVTLIAFFRISKAAGILLIPYLLWVSFASYLNYSIFILN